MTIEEQYAEITEKLEQFKKSNLWQIIVQHVNNDLKDIDSSWHLYLPDSKEFAELRTRKCSLTYLLNIEKMFDSASQDLAKRIKQKSLYDVEISKDYDQETNIEEGSRNNSQNNGKNYGTE